MLRVGILSESGPSFQKALPFDATLYGFIFSEGSVSFSEIFESGFATPARYVAEVFYRLSQLDNGQATSAKFIFNPFSQFDKLNIAVVLDWLETTNPSTITVFVDRKGTPIGYFFPTDVGEEKWKHLRFLSTADGYVDAEMLSLLFGCEASVEVSAHVQIGRDKCNGFDPHLRGTYDWMARRTVARLQQSAGNVFPPVMAVMPHHAGDALFLSLAMKWTNYSFDKIAISEAYAPIVSAVVPDVSVHAIIGPPFLRDPGNPVESRMEGRYVDRIKDDLPTEPILLYLRPSRSLSRSSFHFIDHFAFALGRHFANEDSLLVRNLRAAARQARSDSTRPKVLLHFDAGWALKVYPKARQQELVDLLVGRGFSVDVLSGDGSELKNCKVHVFENLDQISTLIRSHDLVIGMDSFPVHWATFVAGKRSICLFSSTRQEHARAPDVADYVALDNGMPCCPCSGVARCPMFGGSYCRNFSPPELVAEAASQMMLRSTVMTLNSEQIPSSDETIANFHTGLDFRLPRRFLKQRIEARKLAGFYNMPLFAILIRRFFGELRSKGLRIAVSKTAAFVKRQSD